MHSCVQGVARAYLLLCKISRGTEDYEDALHDQNEGRCGESQLVERLGIVDRQEQRGDMARNALVRQDHYSPTTMVSLSKAGADDGMFARVMVSRKLAVLCGSLGRITSAARLRMRSCVDEIRPV